MFRAISSETEASAQAGFTLVEVLVALSVVAVSLAAIGSLIAVTTRALTPRSRSARPSLLLTHFVASLPKRSVNFAQPVCGTSVITMTASPIASSVPAGR